MNNLDRKVTRQVSFLLIFSYDYARMNKKYLNKEGIMEYKKHITGSLYCTCAACNGDISLENVLLNVDRLKNSNRSIATDLQKSKMARINRESPASHHRRKVMVEGYNQRQAPPKRNTLRIFQTISEHPSNLLNIKFPTVFGVRGVTNAPPSAETRENVYEPIQRENQTESIAV